MRVFLVGLAVGVGVALASGVSAAYMVEPTLTRVAGVETRCYEPGTWDRGEEYGGWYEDGVVSLAPWACRWTGRTLVGERPVGWRRTLTAKSWHLFAHEVAHSEGFDHGELTVGADCQGWRIMRGLMWRAGIDKSYRLTLWRASAHRASCPSSAPSIPG